MLVSKKIAQFVCCLKQSLYICPRKQTNDNENNFRKCMLVALLTTSKVVRKQYSCIYTKINFKDILRGLSHCDKPLFFIPLFRKFKKYISNENVFSKRRRLLW